MSNPTPGVKYEFTPNQEHEIYQLTRYMKVVAVIMLVLGGLTIAGGLLIAVAGRGGDRWLTVLMAGVVGGTAVTMAAFLFQATGSFRMIVDTTGRDVRHLMTAVGHLRMAFAVQAVGYCLQAVAWAVAVGLTLTRVVRPH